MSDLDIYEAYSASYRKAVKDLERKVKSWYEADKSRDKKEIAKKVVEVEKAFIVCDTLNTRLEFILDKIESDESKLRNFLKKYDKNHKAKKEDLPNLADEVYKDRDMNSDLKYQKLFSDLLNSKSKNKPYLMSNFNERSKDLMGLLGKRKEIDEDSLRAYI